MQRALGRGRATNSCENAESQQQNYRKEYNSKRNVVAGNEMQTNCRNAAEAETNTSTQQQHPQQQQQPSNQQQWLILAEK